jgi:hypothetical protein
MQACRVMAAPLFALAQGTSESRTDCMEENDPKRWVRLDAKRVNRSYGFAARTVCFTLGNGFQRLPSLYSLCGL